jgi:hypothetical protein
VVNAGFGLGAPVVDGVTSPDMIRFARDGAILASTIVRKPIVTVVGENGLEERSAAEPHAPALGPPQLEAQAEAEE